MHSQVFDKICFCISDYFLNVIDYYECYLIIHFADFKGEMYCNHFNSNIKLLFKSLVYFLKSSIIAFQLSFIQKERVKGNKTQLATTKEEIAASTKAVWAQLVHQSLVMPHQNVCTRYLYVSYSTTILHLMSIFGKMCIRNYCGFNYSNRTT